MIVAETVDSSQRLTPSAARAHHGINMWEIPDKYGKMFVFVRDL